MRSADPPSRIPFLALLATLALIAPAAPALAHGSMGEQAALDDVARFQELLEAPPRTATEFPGPDEVISRVNALADHPWMSVHTIGESNEGRPLKLVEVIDPNSTVPVEDRVVTFLLTQQHGNEPAGTPALLDLLEEIAAGGAIKDTLENQVLLALPQANPDGAAAGTRGNADGIDTNRDHNELRTPEARAMHSVLNDWTVHVALDHHEYGGTGLGNPFPVRIYDYDLTTLFPTHGSVDQGVLNMAKDLMYDGIWPRAEADGYSANEYGEQTLAGEPLEYLAGGPDPGILRNHNGLHHVAGILIETRIDAHPNPFHDEERRAHIQYLTMLGTLEYVHEHAERFIEARAAAIERNLLDPPTHYDEGDDNNPWTGDSDPVELPKAFRVSGDVDEIQEILRLHGLPVGVVDEGDVVHNMDHGFQIHAAAMMMDESSRTVLDGKPTDPILVAVNGTDEAAQEAVPALPVVVFVLVLVALVAGRQRFRRQGD